jgi:hypothetical protein
MFFRSTASAIASASTKSFLLDFHERLDELGCNETNIMPLLPQSPSEKMCSRAGFQADQRRLHVRGIRPQLPLPEFLPHKHLAGLSECH